MIKLWVVFLMVVEIAVLAQTPGLPEDTTSSMTTSQTTAVSTASAIPSTPTTPTSGTGTGAFRLHSFNLLFLPLTITASVFYLSC